MTAAPGWRRLAGMLLRRLPPPARAGATSLSSQPVVTVLRPSRGWVSLNLRELWHYRELVYFLTWREIKVRYKQTVLGALWAIIQPVFTMVVFSIFFGRLAQMPSDGLPYPIFTYVALLPWTYFAHSVTTASNSLVASAHVLGKVYFPRLLIPTSSVLSGLVDFGVSFLVLVALMSYFGFRPTPLMLLAPCFLLLGVTTALGAGLWLSALNVEYRDVKYTVPFLVQLWMYASPVVYPSSLIPEPWRPLYGLNPMVGVIEGFRWSILGTQRPGPVLLVSAAISITLLATGALYFRRTERTFADTV